jgi:IS4 transposase
MAQNTVFHQVIKLIPRTTFSSFVQKHQADRGVRKLDSWTWFGALLFGQLSGHYSIRAIERLFTGHHSKFKKLGFSEVKKSTLADANARRPLGVLEETFNYLLGQAKKVAPKKSGFRFHGKVLALDSSCIDLSLKLCPWAQMYQHRACTKLHTAIDIANDIPEFTVLGGPREQDLPIAMKHFNFKKGSTIVFDRGYLSYEWMNELNEQGVFFVTRARDCFKFKVLKCHKTDRTRGHICDQHVKQDNRKSNRKPKYKDKLRKISYRDPDTGKKYIFLTNRFDLAVQTICDLYKSRWKIELFFKTLKQNLKIKKFLGTTENAVKAQIWTALIAYLLIQILRYSHKTKLSIPDTMAVIGTLILLKDPISRLLADLPQIRRYPPDKQLELNLSN